MLLNRFPGGGVSIEAATAQPAHVLAPYTFFAGENEEPQTGIIPSKGAQTYTPGTANQTIAAGQYLSGIQTIAGDPDLVAGNIKSGVDIFGRVGTFGTPTGAAGDTLIYTSDVLYSTNPNWASVLSIYFKRSGAYRFRQKAYMVGGGNIPGYIKLTRNGVDIAGSEFVVTDVGSEYSGIKDNVPVTKVADYWINAGETISVLMRAYFTTYTSAIISSFSISANWPDVAGLVSQII